MNKIKRLTAALLAAVIMTATQVTPAFAAEMPFAGATPEQQILINSSLDVLPAPIIAMLGKYQRQITTPQWLAANCEPAYPGNITTASVDVWVNGAGKIVQREVYISPGPRMIPYLFHELGHIIVYEQEDAKGWDITNTPEFQQIFIEEAPLAALSAYDKTDPGEYFAESFAMFYLNPAALAACPKTVSYIASVVNSYQEPQQ